MGARWKFWIERVDYSRRITVRGAEMFDDRSVSVCLPFTMQRVAADELAPQEPMLNMDEYHGKAMLQALVDACWEEGIRPTGVEDFKRVNDAQGRHLNDMRSLVAKMADAPLP